jgi:predicted nucleic acid-binding protein
LLDPSKPLVLDASVAINLNATGNGIRILDAIPNPVVLLDSVSRELEAGRAKGRSDAELVSSLVAARRAEIVSLCGECEGNFLALVCGSGSATLDDGEAATIAWAVAHGGIPIIDERKGLSICKDRFPSVPAATTTDIFAHDGVVGAFGRDALGDAIFNALTLARMRVQESHISWVVDMIGASRAQLCHSLPLSVRRAQIKLSALRIVWT